MPGHAKSYAACGDLGGCTVMVSLASKDVFLHQMTTEQTTRKGFVLYSFCAADMYRQKQFNQQIKSK